MRTPEVVHAPSSITYTCKQQHSYVTTTLLKDRYDLLGEGGTWKK